MLKNIVLIGFMGSGKSTIGRHLAKTLGYPLLDTDHEIVEQEKRHVSQIFEEEGEEAFRDLESNLLQNLHSSTCHKHIVATGGGIILREQNRALLLDLGFVVWLRASPETILERTSGNKQRPLLQAENPAALITEMLAEREPIYEKCAHLSLETKSLNFSEITTGIIESARYHYGSK